VKSDDGLSQAFGEFDLVHSFIVLQHIRWGRGEQIITKLAQRVSPNGYLAIQFYTLSNLRALVRGLVRLRYVIPPVNWVRNVLRRRPAFEQAMQLHIYSLPKILRILRTNGFPNASLSLDSEAAGGYESVFLIARRTYGDAGIRNPLS